MSDHFKNHARSTIAVPPSPATTGTTLTVQSGQGGLFPTPPFEVEIWPIGQVANSTNAELAICTAKSGDDFTIERGSPARTIVAGDQIGQPISKYMLELLERGISVKAFGAKGDDATDNSTAINAAIDWVDSAGGGTVYFPPGIYRIGSTINFIKGVSIISDTAVGMWVESDDIPITSLKWVGADQGTMIEIPNRWNGRFENFYLDGNALASVVLDILASQSAIYRNLIIRNTTSTEDSPPTDTYAVVLRTEGATSPSWPSQFPSAALNLFENVIIHNLGATGGLLLDGAVDGSDNTIAAVTENLFVNCKVEGGTGYNSVVLNKCCDTNTWIGGTISGPINGTALVLNFHTVNDEVHQNVFLSVAIDNVDGTGGGVDARNNVAFNHLIGCFLPTQGSGVVMTNGVGGGKVKATACLLANKSFQDMTQPTPGSSPWTYTNDFAYALEFEMWGGTISEIKRIRNGTESGIGGTLSEYRSLMLEPGDGVKITYTGAPTVQITPH